MASCNDNDLLALGARYGSLSPATQQALVLQLLIKIAQLSGSPATTIPALVATGKCFFCYGPLEWTAISTMLWRDIAVAGGATLSSNPITLAGQYACDMMEDSGVLTLNYLAQLYTLSTTTDSLATLVTATSCYHCYGPAELIVAEIVILQAIAGSTETPQQLITRAQCYMCLTIPQLQAMMVGIITGISSIGSTSPFTPTSITGLLLWLDATDNSTVTEDAPGSGQAIQWRDKIAGKQFNAPFDLVQWDGSNWSNGNKTMYFQSDTGTAMMQSATGIAIGVGTGFTFYCVVKIIGTSGAPLVMMGEASDPAYFFLDNAASNLGNNYFAVAAATTVNAQWVSGEQQIYGCRSANLGFTPPTISKNGVDKVNNTTNNASASWASALFLGASDGGPSNILNGHVGEILMWNSVLGTTDRANVITYLKAKWAIP